MLDRPVGAKMTVDALLKELPAMPIRSHPGNMAKEALMAYLAVVSTTGTITFDGKEIQLVRPLESS